MQITERKPSPILARYASAADPCAQVPTPARRQIERGAETLAGHSPVSGRYREHLVAETCLFAGLVPLVRADGPLCGELCAEDKSSCLASAVKQIAGDRAVSYTGITLFVAQHEELVAVERQALTSEQKKSGAPVLQILDERLLSGVDLARELLEHRAKPRDWIGVSVKEFETADARASEALCHQIQDLGFRYIGELRSYGNPDLDLRPQSARFLALHCGVL